MDRHMLHLPDGDLEYVDSGGAGPVTVLLHGALMDELLAARQDPSDETSAPGSSK